MDLIAEIKNRVSIDDVVNVLRLDVNKAGFTNSIYKDEKTPSMKIYSDDNRYYCFATSNGGDQINLYQDYYRLDTAAAIKELAGLFGIILSETLNEKRETEKKEKSFTEQIGELNRLQEELFNCLSDYEKSIYEDIYYKNEYSDNFEAHRSAVRAVQVERLYNNKLIFTEFYNYCKNNPNEKALHYLQNVRQLTPEVLDKFKIFTIENYYQVNNHLKKSFENFKLQQSGLFNENGNLIFANHYIIIPYLLKEQLVYLRGRYFDKNGSTDPKSGDQKFTTGKYTGLKNDKLDLNRTKRFFNYDVLRSMFKGERLYIVEGEFDAMALASIGENAISVPGASNLPEKKYFIPMLEFDVVLCMDQDEAGDGLRNRLLDRFSEYGKKIGIKKLPTKDANDFLIAS